MDKNKKLREMLQCPDCWNLLEESPGRLKCIKCGKFYSVRGGSVIFTESGYGQISSGPDFLILKIKNFLRHYPKFFMFLYRLTTPVFGKSSKSIFSHVPKDALVINIGSGVMSIDFRVIDVDYYPYPNVKVAADATKLPFKDGSIDGVISESLLEHIADANAAIKEIKRVLKPGGWLYISTPFMLGFHSAPGDYYRWTIAGLKEAFFDFEEISSGPACGPTLAFTRMAGEWLSLVLSFGVSQLHQFWNLIFMLVFLPVNLLDYLFIRYKFSSNIAMTIYFMGRKK